MGLYQLGQLNTDHLRMLRQLEKQEELMEMLMREVPKLVKAIEKIAGSYGH